MKERDREREGDILSSEGMRKKCVGPRETRQASCATRPETFCKRMPYT